MYSGWEISEGSRAKLSNLFVQIHPDFIGHHVTYMFGNDAVAPDKATIKVVGQCITDKIQCFVVDVGGTIIRPDGNIYHLTWSIDRSKGAKPVDSNTAIMTKGFEHIMAPIELSTTPKLFK